MTLNITHTKLKVRFVCNNWKYSQVSSQRGVIYHDITRDTANRVTEIESDIRITTDTPYLVFTGEEWGVYCEGLGDNGPRYNGTTLYVTLYLCYWCRYEETGKEKQTSVNHLHRQACTTIVSGKFFIWRAKYRFDKMNKSKYKKVVLFIYTEYPCIYFAKYCFTVRASMSLTIIW